MSIYILARSSYQSNGTLGELKDSTNKHICYTIELPWRNNAPRISCIPTGTFSCTKRFSPHMGHDVWQLQNVPGRSFIEIHPANDEQDLLGCIGVGSEIGVLNGLPAVLHSQDTFKMLLSTLPDNFILTII